MPTGKKKIGVLSTSDPKFRIKVLMCFSALRRGEAVSRSMISSANFSPSPFLGACVTACDTLPRQHGCRGNVYTRYTFVTCHVSDTLFPGWVFLAQVWAGGGFCPPLPLCLVNRITVDPGGNVHSGEDLSPLHRGRNHLSKAQAQAELVL